MTKWPPNNRQVTEDHHAVGRFSSVSLPAVDFLSTMYCQLNVLPTESESYQSSTAQANKAAGRSRQNIWKDSMIMSTLSFWVARMLIFSCPFVMMYKRFLLSEGK